MGNCIVCKKSMADPEHQDENGHAGHTSFQNAFNYIFQITGGRADRCKDDYEKLMVLADGLILELAKTKREYDDLSSLYHETVKGIVIKGWKCVCGCFNGEEREHLSKCRHCGLGRR